ncbi:MAG: crossover junction endodeoxyribonuclease RuvC [Candidatus Kerfeldbacteria bacterium]|nr:crossover junction endodeoxyribonuclease RuvC [Candidatus Kerfeldbacteria bacterium]
MLAIDPGTKYLGYAGFVSGELSDYGVKSIRQNEGVKGILLDLDRIFRRMLDEKRPGELVIERNAFSQIRSNVRLTLAVTHLKNLAEKRRIRVFEVDPRTVRKIVCKDGNATKREVARTLAILYPELKAYLESNRRWRVDFHQNAFDAIAVGQAFLKMSRTFSDQRPNS